MDPFFVWRCGSSQRVVLPKFPYADFEARSVEAASELLLGEFTTVVQSQSAWEALNEQASQYLKAMPQDSNPIVIGTVKPLVYKSSSSVASYMYVIPYTLPILLNRKC